MRILVVEDEAKVAAFLRKGLQQEGFAVDVAAGAREALAKAADRVYDLLLLDIGLPDADGLSVLATLRREGDATPVLLLTARDSVDEKVHGLEAGANDYLTKPFAFRELLARVRVLLRPAGAGGDVLAAGDLTLDLKARRAERRGRVIPLTNKEFALLELLLRDAGRPVSRARLWDHAWGGSFTPESNVVDVHVARLRRKIDRGRTPPLLQTVHGIGYMIGPPTAR